MATIKRTRSPNQTYYHFVVYLPNGDRMYFFTAQQIADEFNLSKSTIYRALKKDHKLFNFGLVKKDYLHKSVVDHLASRELSLIS
tara:strand:- start:1212 stop:1466 length:255 start_codon:yes stop_codon:yes gene_type:complete